MNRVIFLVLIVMICINPLLSQEKTEEDAALEAEKAAVQQATVDYLNGWFSGDSEQIERALHPDLIKRGVMTERKTGRNILSFASKSTMVEYTRAGYGKAVAKDIKDIYVQILDVFQNVACVKVVAPQFMDYLQLAKCDGKWQIVNILWIANPNAPPPSSLSTSPEKAKKKDK